LSLKPDPESSLPALNRRVSAARAAAESRGETFYPGPSRIHLAAFPPKERWNDWVELDSTSWPERVERRYTLVPTTCFNCEAACGLLAYVDRDTEQVRKFEGNPEHPGSRGRNCAKGPSTLNQVTDPDRILYPLKRVGPRGSGQWARVGWNEALDDIAARIRKALVEKRPNQVMYHVGRPGEDGFTERILAAWGVDGHNSHTNVCSSSARAGYHFWMGFDRPSPDHANARVILLVSSHLEAGHYFNPHAQRIVDAKRNGAHLVVLDTRLSNTASQADRWLAPYPGSEAAILLAIARHLIVTRRFDREFVRRWWNWEEYLTSVQPNEEPTFDSFIGALERQYDQFTFEFAAREAGVDAAAIAEVAELVASAGSRLSTHTWRSACAGNLGGWQVARALFLLNALVGAVATVGGTYPNGWNKFVPRPPYMPPHPPSWNQLTWPLEYPLALNELSFLLPQFLKDGRGTLDVYFTRVYNPVWTNPDGFSWIEVLTDETLIGCHVALTPTWSETAHLADYVLPMGLGSERHDLHSYETHDGQWIAFRQPVLRAARERRGEHVLDTRDVNPGEVWEENEFWFELTWRIDPDGSLGIRRFAESMKEPGRKITLDEYYGYIFEHSVPGLLERAASESLTPLEYMRRYGAFQVQATVGAAHDERVPDEELDDVAVNRFGRAWTAASKPAATNIVPAPTPESDEQGRRPVGVLVDGAMLRGFPTPSGRLEFYSSTLAGWGWAEEAVPGYIRSHVHPDRLAHGEMTLISTFRLPVQVHTRSANSKWLDEIAHTNPLWMNPIEARDRSVNTGDLVRVETAIGYFVLKAWVTESIRPGVVACSHHMGRWKTGDAGQRQAMATVGLVREAGRWRMTRRSGARPYESSDPDTARIWWTDVGVHQNLTFPVHPDPVSGMHCWHQAVRVRRAEESDREGDIVVDTNRSREVYREWLSLARSADRVSPDGLRRPYWMLRPLKPARDVYRLPGRLSSR
jgi:anaerobic selenocysteine-containing dehydrogenase